MGDELRGDIARAKSKMRVKIGGGREIKRLESHLWEGERVEQMTTGTYGKGQGLIVLTDRRLLFVQDGMMSQTTEDFPLERVSSVSWSSGALVGKIIIYASGNKAEIAGVNKADGKELVDLVRHRLSEGVPTQQQSAAAPAGNDVTSQLAKLGELRDAGVLTDQEFAAKKAELLGRM